MNYKKVHFLTLGCKVNQYETQCIREKFIEKGYSEVNLEEADTVVINTCTVTHKSDSKSRKTIRRAVRSSLPKSTIVVTGCLAELEKKEIEKIEGVDFILENKYKLQLPSIINDDIKKETSITKEKITYFKGHTRGFVKIQDGCYHNCSYCKVKLVRGEPESKKLKEVVGEIEELINNGYKEVVLTGICLGAYGIDLSSGVRLLDLLKQLSIIEGDYRIRLSSIEPNYVTEKLIDYILKNEKICSHLHMPIQSGDNKILELMKRPYSREEISKKIDYARGKDSHFSFSTDVIVGFPGENKFSIRNTINLLNKMLPVRTHIFNYSQREGTSATDLKEKVDVEKQKMWYKKILNISDEMSFKYRNLFLHEYVEVLTENVKNSWARGYSRKYININFSASLGKRGTFNKLKISKVTRDRTLGT